MPMRDGTSRAPDTGSDLSSVYIRVLVIEVLVLAVLFWVGRHFA